MNFKEQIKNIKQSGLPADGVEDYLIVRCPQTDRFYAINFKDPLGRGNYGSVYRTFLINEKGDLDETNSFAAKLIHLAKEDNKKNEQIKEAEIEGNFLKRYYYTEDPINIEDKQIALITSFIPGKDLSDIIYNKDPDIKLRDFSFIQRINLLASIAMAYNLIHEHTSSTGKALFMSDIKAHNIKVVCDLDKNIFDIYPLDFGFAKEVNNDCQIDALPRGSFDYVAPEIVLKGKGGIKSDIRSLVYDFTVILNGKSPLKHKNRYGFQSDNFFKAPYDLTGILEGCGMPDYPINIKRYIKQFLNRMQAYDYDMRPDPDEVLRFFVTLHNFCKTYETYNKKGMTDFKTLKAYAAKLSLLSTNHWNDKIDEDEIKTFGQYDFDNDPKNFVDPLINDQNLIAQISNEVDHYLNKPTLFRNKRLSTLKQLLAETFKENLFKSPSIAFIKNYKALLDIANLAIEELVDEKNTEFTNLKLNDPNKLEIKNFFNACFELVVKDAQKSNLKEIFLNFENKNPFEKTFILKLHAMQERKDEGKKGFGKAYHLLFSSRLGRTIDKIDAIIETNKPTL